MLRGLVLLLALLPMVAAAQAYRWVDKNGQVHYSQTPPLGTTAEPVRPPPPPSSAPNQDSLNKALDQSIKDEPKKQEDAARQANAAAQKQQQCQQARDQIAYMDSHTARRLGTTDDKGNVSRVTDEQFKERRAELERQVRETCS